MAIIRWRDPFREPFFRMSGWPDIFEEWEAAASPLAVDLYETDDEVTLKTPLAGVKPEDVDISIEGDTVTIHGESKEEKEEKDKKRNYYFREVRYGKVGRNIRLPADVEADKAKADFEDGMLKLTIPKAAKAKPKKVKVKAKQK